MSRDVSIKIKTEGADKTGKQFDSLSGKLGKIGSKGNANGILGLGKAAGVAGAAFAAAAVAVKKTVDALNDCAEAYKVQAKAETQLESAARNNPYLNESSVRALKSYASELQSIGTVGDEKLLPLMAQLAAAGRTQAEIQSIMSAALDASASGAVSLEAAVSGLNLSYSGSIGMLGRQLPQLKSLTKEELKQGKAIEVVAASYKGMAAETAKATGASEQLANAWGDFKENIGEGWEKATAPAKRELAGLLGQLNDIAKAKKELKAATEAAAEGAATEADYQVIIEETTEKLKAAREELLAVQNTIASGAAGIDTAYALSQAQSRVMSLTTELASYETLKGRLAKLAKEEADAAEKSRLESERKAAAEERIAGLNKKATDAIDGYNKAVESAQAKIEARRQLGEKITQNEEDQIMLEAKKAAYITLIESSQGAISGNLEREKRTRADIEALAQKCAEYDQSAEALADKYAKLGKEGEGESWEEQLEGLLQARDAVESLQAGMAEDVSLTVDEKIALEQKYAAAVAEINREIAEGERQSQEERVAAIKGTFETIAGYIQQSAQLIQQAMAFQLEAVQAEKESELEALEASYKKGEMTEEAYAQKKEEIQREAAQKEYRIKMWEWAANIAQATANIAMAAVGAMAQTSGSAAARIIAMGLIGAAGGLQLASLIQSKPVPPSFASGGIVQGSSWAGDNVRANVNSGEMILNAAQQKELWMAANGQGSGGGVNIVVNNSAANIVDAKPSITQRGVELLIDARVKQSLAGGKYNNALIQANQSIDGVRYGV